MFQDNYWWEWWAGFLLLCLVFDWLVVWVDDLWVGSVRCFRFSPATFFTPFHRDTSEVIIDGIFSKFFFLSKDPRRLLHLYSNYLLGKRTRRKFELKSEKICARETRRREKKVDDFVYGVVDRYMAVIRCGARANEGFEKFTVHSWNQNFIEPSMEFYWSHKHRKFSIVRSREKNRGKITWRSGICWEVDRLLIVNEICRKLNCKTSFNSTIQRKLKWRLLFWGKLLRIFFNFFYKFDKKQNFFLKKRVKYFDNPSR